MAFTTINQSRSFAASTGLRQFRGVTMSTAGLLQYPSGSTLGQPVIGTITSDGTTGSTTAVAQEIDLVAPIVEVEGTAGVGLGTYVSFSSQGAVQPSSNAGDFKAGFVVGGSTGAANTRYSVMLLTAGSSVAPA